MGTFKQHFSDSPAFIAFLIVVICQSFTITSAQVQDDKPVLIIFHGVNESRDDMRALASASNETKMFAQVVVVGYDWKKNRIPVAAPRIFNSISNRFPNSNFVLIGNKEGGILAEWIASRVRTAENKIVRVITLNSPLNGQTLKSDGEGAAIEDLQPDSEVLRLLKSPLVNVRSLDFVRLWEKDNKWVDQEGALRELPWSVPATKVIVRTKPYDPHEAIPSLLGEADHEFDAKNYTKVIEVCRYILRIEPMNRQANNLLGLSLYNSVQEGVSHGNTATTLVESFKHLAIAVRAGEEYVFPVAHHHSLGRTPLDFQDVCYGRLIIDREFLAFVSDSEVDHRFVAPLSKVSLSFNGNGIGWLHVEVGRGEGKRKVYNFVSSRVTKSPTFVPISGLVVSVNDFRCDEICPLALQTLYKLIEKAQTLPPPSRELKDLTVRAIHNAVREKNRHAGLLIFSTRGLAWQEMGPNADSKHDFSIGWDEVKKVDFSYQGLQISFKTNGKSRGPEFVGERDIDILLRKLIYKYSGAYERFSSH